MKLTKENENLIVKKINDIYITNRKKYLLMDQNGKYSTLYKGRGKTTSLNDGHIKQHLRGKSTIGIFTGDELTKFICFDIDASDKQRAKWFTLKIIDSLINIGIPQDYIYTSFSGNKGYHVEIFFTEPIELIYMRNLYKIIKEETDLSHLEKGEEVELRPETGQGVKLPLGKHFNTKTNARCWYVDHDLNIIRNFKYILDIKQFKSNKLKRIVQSKLNLDYEGMQLEELKQNENEINESLQYIGSNYKPLAIYQLNLDEKLTIEYYENLYNEGLKTVGTRHNALMNLCRYFRHMEFTPEENEDTLIYWMNEQDTRTYRTPLEDCYKDIKGIVKFIYDKEVGITAFNKEIKISYYEMLDIMSLKSKNDKLIAYSMLIHNKRFTDIGKVFFMTYKQMGEASGLSDRSARRILPKIEKSSLLEVVERNKIVTNERNQFVTKKANKYRFHLNRKETDKQYQINLSDNSINHTYSDCLVSLFTTDELKVYLTKNQYYELINTTVG
jgi:hypothetical protein